jgi:hypothetical protein
MKLQATSLISAPGSVIRLAAIKAEEKQLFFKLCSDHLSIEAIPKRPIIVDFKKIKEHPLRDHELVMWTPHFAVLRNQTGEEITLRRNGRMVIRKAASETVARNAATEVLDLVLKEFRMRD